MQFKIEKPDRATKLREDYQSLCVLCNKKMTKGQLVKNISYIGKIQTFGDKPFRLRSFAKVHKSCSG